MASYCDLWPNHFSHYIISCIRPDGNICKIYNKKFTSTKFYKIVGSWYGLNLGEMQSNEEILFSRTLKNTA